MKLNKVFAIFLLNAFVCFALFIRFFGIESFKFENASAGQKQIQAQIQTQTQNKYQNYKKLGQQQLAPNVHAVIMQFNKTAQATPIYKTAIGKTVDGKCIDSLGNIYEDANEALAITIEGNYAKWAKYYPILKDTKIIEKIYHVAVHEHTLDIWVQPGVLVQLDEHIENLEEFYKEFPHLFKKGTLIDLRCTKRVGISTIKTK